MLQETSPSLPDNLSSITSLYRYVQSLEDVNKTLLSATDVHCCADVWLLPTGWHPCKTFAANGRNCLETYGQSFDLTLSMAWGEMTIDSMAEVSGNRIGVGPISTAIYPATGSALDWMYEQLGTVFLGAPEMHEDPDSVHDPTGITLFYPPTELISVAVKEMYAGMVAGTQFALDNQEKRISSLSSFPIPQPGYSVQYICDHAIEEGLCNVDCTSIDIFPFGLPREEIPFYEGTGVHPCGAYLQGFNSGKPTYISIEPGTLFTEICPEECQLADR